MIFLIESKAKNKLMVKARKMCYYAFRVSTSLVCSFVFRLRLMFMRQDFLPSELTAPDPTLTSKRLLYTFNTYKGCLDIEE